MGSKLYRRVFVMEEIPMSTRKHIELCSYCDEKKSKEFHVLPVYMQ